MVWKVSSDFLFAITFPVGALNDTVSLNQPFTLTTTISRIGTSPYGSGRLQIDYDNNYFSIADSVFRVFDQNTNEFHLIKQEKIVENDSLDEELEALKSDKKQ